MNTTRYLDAFDKYSDALRAIVVHMCGLNVTEWDYDGYEASFTFRWDFTAQVQKLHRPEFDVRYIHLHTRSQFDDAKPLDEELARLNAEVEHLAELRNVMIQRARDLAVASRKETK